MAKNMVKKIYKHGEHKEAFRSFEQYFLLQPEKYSTVHISSLPVCIFCKHIFSCKYFKAYITNTCILPD